MAACFAVLSLLALGAVITVAHPAHANTDTPCGVVLCLAGEAAGQSSGSGRTGHLTSYFSIRVYKEGNFKPSDMFTVRYLQHAPKTFVIVADDGSPWAEELRCDELNQPLSEADQ
jgi:hypothetical protein